MPVIALVRRCVAALILMGLVAAGVEVLKEHLAAPRPGGISQQDSIGSGGAVRFADKIELEAFTDLDGQSDLSLAQRQRFRL